MNNAIHVAFNSQAKQQFLKVAFKQQSLNVAFMSKLCILTVLSIN